MGERKDKAIELHSNRYTCSQAVACAFCDLVNVDEVTMKNMVRRYSGGAYNVCGAIMGAYVIINYLNGDVNLDNPAEPIKENIELDNKKVDYTNIKNDVRDKLGKYFYKETECKPMVITVIQEV